MSHMHFARIFEVGNEFIYITPSIPNYKLFQESWRVKAKNLGESKHFKFDQNYRENYKDL